MKTINDLLILDFKYDLRKSKNAKKGLIDLCNIINDKLGSNLNMVEIGSFSGVSGSIFSQFFYNVNCVDPWQKEYDKKDHASDPNLFDMREIENQFDDVSNIFTNIKKFKMTSLEASKLFENNSLDFVYIDGNHTYNFVKQDIQIWLPKIKKSSLICGHDYQGRFQGTIDAVNELLGKPDKIFPDTSWIKFL